MDSLEVQAWVDDDEAGGGSLTSLFFGGSSSVEVILLNSPNRCGLFSAFNITTHLPPVQSMRVLAIILQIMTTPALT
jgi:hypothetical protein